VEDDGPAPIEREVEPIGIARNDFTRPASGLPAHPAREPVDQRREGASKLA